MIVDVGLEGFGVNVFFGLCFKRDDALFRLNGEIHLNSGFVGGEIEGGNLDAGKLLAHIAFGKGPLEFLEDVVSYQHLGGRHICHCAQETDIQRENLEDIEVFVEFERVLDFTDTVNLVDEACVFEPGDGYFKVF